MIVNIYRSKSANLLVLGGVLVILSFIGIPGWIKEIVYPVIGFLVVIFALAGIRPEGATVLRPDDHGQATPGI